MQYLITLIMLTISTNCFSQGKLPLCEGSYTSSSWTNCEGTTYFSGSAKYVGTFKNGKANGLGTFYDGNGGLYFGEFINGKRAGRGTYYFVDGTTKEGIWRDDNFIQEERLSLKPNSAVQPQVTNNIPSASLDDSKKKCTELGFKPATEAFGKCVLKLSN